MLRHKPTAFLMLLATLSVAATSALLQWSHVRGDLLWQEEAPAVSDGVDTSQDTFDGGDDAGLDYEEMGGDSGGGGGTCSSKKVKPSPRVSGTGIGSDYTIFNAQKSAAAKASEMAQKACEAKKPSCDAGCTEISAEIAFSPEKGYPTYIKKESVGGKLTYEAYTQGTCLISVYCR